MMQSLVRVNGKRAGLGTSDSLAFTETTPLDSTHLLVAVVQHSGSFTPEAGWTEAPGAPGSNLRMFARQGDGVKNSFSFTGTNNAHTFYIMGFRGFISATALAGEGGAMSASPVTISLASPPAGKGLVIAAPSPGSIPTAWGSLSNGFEFVMTPPVSALLLPGVKEYRASSDASTLLNPSPATTAGSRQMVVYPLKIASSGAVGSSAVSFAIGATPVNCVVGAET